MDFVISVVVLVQKELIKVIRIEQTAKCAKATNMLKAIMELRYVQFVMGLGEKVTNLN